MRLVAAVQGGLNAEEFWYVMDHRNWVHPHGFGKRYDYGDLPKSIDKLEDDPLRSSAGELLRAGGLAKRLRRSVNSCEQIICAIVWIARTSSGTLGGR